MKAKSALLSIFLKTKQLVYKDGEIIIRAGDTPSGIFYIEKGFVKVYAIEQNGEENIHIIYKEGEVFPIMWAIKGTLKDVYYQSLGKSVMRKLPRDEFMKLISHEHKAHMELVSIIMSIISVHTDRIENLEIARSYPRIISRLLSLAGRFGEGKKRIVIKVPLNHQDIAFSINMTRETASRDLEKIKREGLISYKGKEIVIRNIDKLKDELSRSYEKERL